MRWTQKATTVGSAGRPFSQDGPWNRIIPANATYSAINAAWPALDWSFQTWLSGDGFSINIYQATTSDPLFNVRYFDTWSNVNAGTWARTGNSLATENSIVSASSTSFPNNMNPYSTTVATNPATQTKPPASAFNPLVNPGTLPFQVRVPAGAVPSPGSDGHWVIMQPDGMIFECYSAIKLTQAQNAIVTTRYQMIDPRLAGDGWSNGLTASMLSVMAGVVRNSEIDFAQSGTTLTIPHAMKIAVPGNLISTSAAYPALAFDISALTESPNYNGTGALPMGVRLAVPYSTNLSARGTYGSNIGQAMAVAAQRYGFIVTDRGGSALTVFNERSPTQARLTAWNFEIWEDVNWVIDNLQRVTSPV